MAEREKAKVQQTVGTRFPSKDNSDKSSLPVQDTDELIDKNSEWDRMNLRYGWGSWKPEFLQVFNSIRWFVFFTCVFSFFQGYIVNGVINAVITTLEKRFELPSSKSGLIVSSNDFFAFVLVLIISFYGGQRNKPKFIAMGIVILGIGSFIFSLPHFLTGIYHITTDAGSYDNVCRDVGNSSVSLCNMGDWSGKQSNLNNYLYIFMLGNALHGAGSTPMFTLGTTYIDDNSKSKMTPLYLGLIYASASLGVGAGYMLGAQTLNLFTDFNEVSLNELGITPMDPRWVGAWWISFVIGGCIMMLVAIPLLGFPRELPGTAKLRSQKESEAYKTKEDNMDKASGKNWKEFPSMMWALVRNPTFMFLSLATCTEGIIVNGIASFGAKFLQEKFNLPAAFAGFLMGIITLPGAGGGMMFGGYLAKKLKLKCRGIIRMNMIVAMLALICGCLFLIQCPTQKIAGVTTTYGNQREWNAASNLTNTCNAKCRCSAKTYEPVCGLDGQIYFTPCHAGCTTDYDWMEGPIGPFKMYKNCSCIAYSMSLMFLNKYNGTNSTDVDTVAMTTEPNTVNLNQTNNNGSSSVVPPPGAYEGVCLSDCKLIWVVVPFLFLGMFLTFSIVSPAQTATMRCVTETQKSLAVGFQWLFLRLLGTTPGPLILGSIIDSACKVWQDVCGETGSCWIYEKTDMGIRIFVWWCLTKGLCLLFFFCAQYFHVVETNSNTGDKDKKSSHPVEMLKVVESDI